MSNHLLIIVSQIRQLLVIKMIKKVFNLPQDKMIIHLIKFKIGLLRKIYFQIIKKKN